MKKRIFAALAASLLAGSIFTSCSNNAENSSQSESSPVPSSEDQSQTGSSDTSDNAESIVDYAAQAIADRTETVHLVVNWFTWSGAPGGLDRIVDAMNALTVPELNIEIEMQVTDFASRNQQMTLAMAGGEQIDLYYSTGLGLTGSVQNEYCMDLEMEDKYGNSLIETYGQDIIDTMGWDVINTSRVNGVLYGTPNQHDLATGRCAINVRTDLLQKAEEYMDLEPDYESAIWKVESRDDIVTVLKALHDAVPELTTFHSTTTTPAVGWTDVDNLGGDVFGVLTDYGQGSSEVVNFFETDSYRDYVAMMVDLNQYGCISPDALTDTTSDAAAMEAGTICAYYTSGKPDITAGSTIPQVCVQGGPDFTYSGQIGGFCWMMGYTTVDPVAAMQYLNFMYASPEWNNLFMYGEQGVDYTLNDEGLVVQSEDSDFNHGMLWLGPAEFKGYVKEGNPPDLWEQYIEFNNNSIVSLASGFSFDTAPIATQYAAVTSAYNRYQKSIEFGFESDWQTAIDEMNEALMTAGLQDIIDEKQAQLDAWLALKE